MTDTSELVGAEEHRLRAGALSLFDSVIMAVAGVAPACSIAASTAARFGAVALGGAASLLYCGIAMFGIVFAPTSSDVSVTATSIQIGRKRAM